MLELREIDEEREGIPSCVKVSPTTVTGMPGGLEAGGLLAGLGKEIIAIKPYKPIEQPNDITLDRVSGKLPW